MKIYLDNNLGVTNVEQEELTQDTIGYNILKVYIPNAVLTPYDTFTCYYGALLQNGRKVGWFAMEARTSSDADYEANYTLYKATLEQCVVSVEGKVYIGCQVLLGNSGNATLIKKNTAVVQFNVRKSVAINNDILILDTDQTTTDVLESYKNLLENALLTYATKAEVYTKAQVDALLLQKQNTLTFDSTPTANSTNPVTSGGVKTALDLKADKSTAVTHTGNQLQDYSGNNIYPNVRGISTEQLDDELRQTIFDEVYTNITSQCGVETGHYINRDDGTLLNSGSAQLSDYIDLTQIGAIYVTGKSQYLTCLYTFYDADKNFISTGGYDGNNEKYWVREKIEATGNIVYVRCCSYQTPLIIETFEYVSKIEELSQEVVIDETHLKNITENYELSNAYVDKRNGSLVTNNNSKVTPLIPCSTNDTFYISGESAYDTCLIATYNESNHFLRYYGNTTSDRYVYKNYEFIPQSNEKYVRFCGYEYTWYPLIIKKQFSKYELKDKIADLASETINLNVLYGKKYVACGDSFTEGDQLSIDKTYPNLIGTRNNMIINNMGRNGGYVHYDSTSLSFLSSTSMNYYQRIPKDADYITLAFGLNELENTIGDEASTDNTTIWGAYNEVLTWIFANIPNAKVGIIANDSWFTESFRDVLKSIAKYWGISFLDLKGEDVPLMIGGKYYNVSQTAIDLRNSMYKISSSNRHPNELGHLVRSYIIENWLRTI